MRALTVAAVLSCLAVCVVPASADPTDQIRLALHVQPHATKATVCGEASPNATGTPCSEYVTRADLLTGYDVYLVAVRIPPGVGVRSFNATVNYDDAPASGVDVLGWTSCAPENQTYTTGAWPQSGSTIQFFWSRCDPEAGGDEGIQAVGGALYVTAYSPDRLEVSAPGWKEGDFSGCFTDRIPLNPPYPAVAFSAGAAEAGENPCEDAPYIPTECGPEPAILDFGTQYPGQTATRSFRLVNDGSDSLRVAYVVPVSLFTLLETPSPFRLPPGETTEAQVQFRAVAKGTWTGRVYTGADCGVISLAAHVPDVCDQPDSLAFDDVELTATATLDALFTNTGPTAFELTPSVGGNDAFSVAGTRVTVPPERPGRFGSTTFPGPWAGTRGCFRCPPSATRCRSRARASPRPSGPRWTRTPWTSASSSPGSRPPAPSPSPTSATRPCPEP